MITPVDEAVLKNAIEEARMRLSVSAAVRDPLVVIETKELIHLLHAAQAFRRITKRKGGQEFGIPAVIDALRKNVIHGDGRLYNPAGHNPLMARAADILDELYEDSFRLAANQCKAGYLGDGGDHQCRILDVLNSAPIMSKYHGANGFDGERFIAEYEAWRTVARSIVTK